MSKEIILLKGLDSKRLGRTLSEIKTAVLASVCPKKIGKIAEKCGRRTFIKDFPSNTL